METIAGKRGEFIAVNVDEARHAIASAFLTRGNTPDDPDRPEGKRLGGILLQSHQVEAIARLQNGIAEFGGALLCDPVGTGKTFCALAIAASHERTLVVGPAVLRQMWDQASAVARVPVSFVSHESLSRRLAKHSDFDSDFDFVIVDEAHHARNAAAKRFAALSRIVAGSDVLLLTATPIHNRRRDLDALLSLFLGERASALSNAELGRCVVRREGTLAAASIGIPVIAPVRWYETPHDDTVASALLALPPPLPPRDGGDGGVLIAHSLIRQWASSDAALRGGLIRRRQRSIALIAALESGTYPSRAELAAWSIADDSVQLAFAELVASSVDETAALLAAIRAHHDAVSCLLEQIGRDTPRDDASAGVIREIRALYPDVPVVAFSQYEDTVTAMFARLASDGGVAALTGRGGLVAGGAISRAEVIARFAPEASGHKRPSRAETVSLLITTDLLSEGVNLQDAGVVVHLDLPWTPARMEQRLGRIARIGSRHSRVYAYAIHPPASAEAVARIERILEKKMRSASVLVGDFPSLAGTVAAQVGLRNEPRLSEELRARLMRWLNESHAASRNCGRVRVAAVTADVPGFIAACTRGAQTMLAGSLDGRVTDDPVDLLRCTEIAEYDDRCVDESAARAALADIATHLEASSALGDIPPGRDTSSHVKRRVLRRIALTVNRARPHVRSRIAALAGEARNAVLSRIGAHRERELAAIVSLEMPDERWLEAVLERCAERRIAAIRGPNQVHEILALILFVRDDKVNALSPAKES